MRARFAGVVLVSLWLVSLWLAAPALACHNAVAIRLDALVRRLDEADRTLLSGRTREAMRNATWVLRVLDGRNHDYELYLEGRGAERRARAMRERAQVVLAVAVARRDGHVDRRRWVPQRVDGDTRARNLTWARSVLEPRATDPVGKARYAEVLARAPETRAEALRILTTLEEQDLVPDAWAHRLLAELSDERGDRARRDRAVLACQARAGRLASTICPRLIVASR